jgi:SPRY domain
VANPTPLKISTTFETRDGTSATKDSRITNLLVEPKGDETHFLKRPGYAIYDGAGWTPLPALGAIPLPGNSVLSFAGSVATGPVAATVQLTGQSFGTYATWDPTAKSAGITLSGGNLIASNPYPGVGVVMNVTGNQYKFTGKWYAELKLLTSSGTIAIFGLVSSTDDISDGIRLGTSASQAGYGYENDAHKDHSGTQTSYGAAWGVNDIISIVFDAGAGTLSFWKNGVDQGQAFTGIPGSHKLCSCCWNNTGTSGTIVLNAGPTFFYTPPIGYSGWGV